MLHGIINVQGTCLDVRDAFQKNTIFYILHMFSYKSLASGALILGIIVIATNNVTVVIYNLFYHLFSNAYTTKIYRHTNRK